MFSYGQYVAISTGLLLLTFHAGRWIKDSTILNYNDVVCVEEPVGGDDQAGDGYERRCGKRPDGQGVPANQTVPDDDVVETTLEIQITFVADSIVEVSLIPVARAILAGIKILPIRLRRSVAQSILSTRAR